MGELVPDHVDADEVVEVGAVTIAEDHLLAVPEGIVVLLLVVHRRDEREALGVEGALERRPVEPARSPRGRRRPGSPVGRTSPGLPSPRTSFGQRRGVLRVVHRALDDRLGLCPWLLPASGARWSRRFCSPGIGPRRSPRPRSATTSRSWRSWASVSRGALLPPPRRPGSRDGRAGTRRDPTEDVRRDDPAAEGGSQQAGGRGVEVMSSP